MIATIEKISSTPAAELALRRATPADRDALIEMYVAFEPKGVAMGLPPHRNPEIWLDQESQFPNFIALDGDLAVGHSLLCPEGDSAEIAVFIRQGYRGKGLGKRLLAAMIDEARRRGLHRVWGTTELENVSMLRLARALGFVSSKDPREFHLDLAALPNEADHHTST